MSDLMSNQDVVAVRVTLNVTDGQEADVAALPALAVAGCQCASQE